jgi:DNA processing protein
MPDVRYRIGFNRVIGVGPAKVRALIDHFGDLETAWQAEPYDLQEAGLDRRPIENLLATRAKIDLN